MFYELGWDTCVHVNLVRKVSIIISRMLSLFIRIKLITSFKADTYLLLKKYSSLYIAFFLCFTIIAFLPDGFSFIWNFRSSSKVLQLMRKNRLWDLAVLVNSSRLPLDHFVFRISFVLFFVHFNKTPLFNFDSASLFAGIQLCWWKGAWSYFEVLLIPVSSSGSGLSHASSFSWHKDICLVLL